MHPESEHILDWFHLTMRITVLGQFAKGLVKSDPEPGEELQKILTKIKWHLWHGNAEKALSLLEDCEEIFLCTALEDVETIHYKNQKKLVTHLEDLHTYVRNNCHLIPNYGERWRYGETISSSFVESTVNEVITKRMVKKQQMQWSHVGAHYLLQARNATLNGELAEYFEQWYPGIKIDDGDKNSKALG